MLGKMRWIPVAVLMLVGTLTLHADSPITSTDFHRAYSDIAIVKEAAESDGILTEKMAAMLSAEDYPIDDKAAIINALSWDFEGKSNAARYMEYLKQKYYGSEIDSTTFEPLTGDELFCLGYLRAMDDYFDVTRALDMLDLAWQKNDTSFTVSMIYAIVEAQEAMDYDWCEVWLLIDDVLSDEMLEFDMREKAVSIIVEYMILYADECEDYNEY